MRATVLLAIQRPLMTCSVRISGRYTAVARQARRLEADCSVDWADSVDIAERLRRAVADLRIEHGESAVAPVVTVTVGAGVVSPAIGRSPSGALQLADEALYSAKQAGRNCVRMLGSEEYDFLETGVFDASDLKHRG